VRFDRYQRNRRTDWNLGTEFSPVVATRLAFRNESAAAPASRRTPPPARRSRPEPRMDRHRLAPALKPGEAADLDLGPRRRPLRPPSPHGYADVEPFKAAEESFEITLRTKPPPTKSSTSSSTSTAATTTKSPPPAPSTFPAAIPTSVRFSIPVKAGASQAFTYTVRYTW
jgi:hypothetical protein